MIDLSKLLNYYKDLKTVLERIYSEELTWENVDDYSFSLDVDHPDWVKAHFPLILIYHNPKAGKLRSSKSINVMYQNHNNILTQVVWTANEFGNYYRKNKHKGFSSIVAAIRAEKKDLNHFYSDKQKPKKYKNFIEFANLHDASNIYIKALCEILEEHYHCDSTGQLRLI